MVEDAAENTSVQLARTIAAPRDRVFDAWTDPEQMMQWWGRGPGMTVPAAEVDLREGGRYRIVMRGEGLDTAAVGTFLEVNPPGRLVYSFHWEPDLVGAGDSLVTVEFRDLGQSTEVLLTHDGFEEPGVRGFHGVGWTVSFDRLAAVCTGSDPGF